MILIFLNHPLFLTKWKDNAPGASVQELEIDRHMDLNYDLFVDLTPDFNQPPSQKDRIVQHGHNMKRMSAEQLKHGEITILREIKLFTMQS